MSTGSRYNYRAIPPSTLPLPQGLDVDSARRARRRFMSGLAIALIIYITLVSFLGVHHESHMEASNVLRL
jgi:hypothetical protein